MLVFFFKPPTERAARKTQDQEVAQFAKFEIAFQSQRKLAADACITLVDTAENFKETKVRLALEAAMGTTRETGALHAGCWATIVSGAMLLDPMAACTWTTSSLCSSNCTLAPLDHTRQPHRAVHQPRTACQQPSQVLLCILPLAVATPLAGVGEPGPRWPQNKQQQEQQQLSQSVLDVQMHNQQPLCPKNSPLFFASHQ